MFHLGENDEYFFFQIVKRFKLSLNELSYQFKLTLFGKKNLRIMSRMTFWLMKC